MPRLFVLSLLFTAAPALAQPMGVPMLPPSGSPSAESTDADIDAAVAEAVAAASAALADSTAPDVLEGLMTAEELAAAEAELGAALDSLDTALVSLMSEMGAAMAEAMTGAMGEMSAEMSGDASGVDWMQMASATSAPKESAPRGRLFSDRGPQVYAPVTGVYGDASDSFPDQTRIRGVVVDAGSQRLCRAGRPAVSRWLKIRLTDTPSTYPPVHMVVAVECDELDSRHYVGRRVSMTAWRAIPSRPVRMARNNVPEVDAPLYLTYPGNVTIGG